MSGHRRQTHRVCFCALAVVLWLAAAPAAWGDDSVPAIPDPTTVVPAPPEVPGGDQTPVVPTDQPTISAVVPPVSTDPATEAAPPIPGPGPAGPAHENPPRAAPGAHSGDGNTSSDNSRGITQPVEQTGSKTVVWNWTWNCEDDPDPVDLPDPPDGVTRIVINWNWDCEGVAPPPPLSARSVTDCTGCNIVINVRVASPGDTGAVTQTTQVDATSLAAGVAEATQAAAQTVVPPQPPVVSPPAPPQIAAPVPPASVTAVVDPVSVPSPDPVVVEPPSPPVAPMDVLPPAPPRAAAAPVTGHTRPLRKPRPAKPRVVMPRVAVATATHTVSVVRVHTVVRWRTRTTRPATRADRPPFLPAPSAPAAPTTFVPAVSEPHANGAFTPFALSAGAIGALLLMFLAYAAPGLQTVRPRPAQANPDPPG